MEKNIDQNRSGQRFQLILTYIHTSEQYKNTQNCPPAIISSVAYLQYILTVHGAWQVSSEKTAKLPARQRYTRVALNQSWRNLSLLYSQFTFSI